MLAGQPLPGDLDSRSMWVLSAWLLVEDQILVAPLGGVLGINWAGAREPLKSAGYWDDERDCIPDDLVGGLRIVAREFAAWKLCDDCRAATRRPKVCSRCGGVIIERHAAPAKRGAEDELRAELEAEGAYGE